MSRPRSDEKRTSLLDAATQVISTQGLSATATSAIAKEAGVSNGSLFLYFETKTVLLNELYVVLKSEMGVAAFADIPSFAEPREQLHLMWVQWLRWATTNPAKRRVLAQLEVAEDISVETHALVRGAQRDMAELVEQCLATGPQNDLSLSFALTLTSAIADATMDALIRDPANAEPRTEAAFNAVWRVLAG